MYIKHQPFAYIQPITFAYVNNNCSLIATLLSLHLLFFRQQPVQPFFHSFLPAFSFLQPCVSATQQPIPFFVFTTIATHPIVFRQPFLSIYLTVVFNQPSFNPILLPCLLYFFLTTQPACNQLMSYTQQPIPPTLPFFYDQAHLQPNVSFLCSFNCFLALLPPPPLFFLDQMCCLQTAHLGGEL